MAKKRLKEMKKDLDENLSEDNADNSLGETKKNRVQQLKDILFAGVKRISRFFFSSKKASIITAASMVLFICLITGGMMFLWKSSEPVKDSKKTSAGKQDIQSVIPVVKEPVFEDIIVLKPFERIRLMNDSNLKFISLNMALELSSSRYKKQVQAMEEKIRQIITEKMENMTWFDLRSPEGKIMLKYDLLKQMNSIFSEVMIRNIYFTNFLMQ